MPNTLFDISFPSRVCKPSLIQCMTFFSLRFPAPAHYTVCDVLNDVDVTIDSGKLPAETAMIAPPQRPPHYTVTPTSPFIPLLPSLYLNNNYSASETVFRLAWVLRNGLLRIISIRCFEIRYTKKIVRICSERGMWMQTMESIGELWGGFSISGVNRDCKMPVRHR